MKKPFKQLVLDFLGEEVIESESYAENEIILNLRDVNWDILGVQWEHKLSHYLTFHNHSVTYSYGNGDWVTVHKTN